MTPISPSTLEPRARASLRRTINVRAANLQLAGVAVVAALLATAVGAGVVLAGTAGGGGNQITGCVMRSGGALRVVSNQSACSSGEYRIMWSEQGIRFRGPWKAPQKYARYDAVASGGAAWIALKASKAVNPGSNTSVWAPVAQAGSGGSKGTTGVVGSQGAAGQNAPVSCNRAFTTEAWLYRTSHCNSFRSFP